MTKMLPFAGEFIPVDESVRERIRRDLESSFSVEAGAGTGKTTLLVDRIFNLVVKGKAGIDEIAAITFTEKAAAELKLRVREKIERQRNTATDSAVERLDHALAKLDNAQISTIHSFASSLLKERPIEAGLDPKFETLDEIQQDMLFDQRWNAWMDVHLDTHFDLFRRAIRAGLRAKDMRNLAASFYDNRDLVPFLIFERPCYDSDAFFQDLKKDLANLATLLPSCVDREDKGYQAIVAAQQAVADFESLDPTGDLEQFLMKELEIKPEGNQNNWICKEDCATQKEICRSLKDRLESLRVKIRMDVVQQVAHALKSFITDFQEWKFSRGILDFQDLLISSRDLVKNDKNIRGYFQERYKYILVDEFQDTDPLQVELIFFLAEQEPVADTWIDVRLTPGKLFLVGDPKQSIYRFRRADIEMFDHANRKLAEVGTSLAIQQNFRSVPGVIGWVNDIFNQLITPSGSYSPRYIPIVSLPASSFENDFRTGVFEVTADYEIEAVKMDEAREIEAKAVVQTIAKIRREKWTVRDESTGKLREVEFRDIALLFPTYTGVQIYEDALKKTGLPYLLEGGKQYYQRQEVRSLINCLMAIDNPVDELAVYGALHSIFFGVSDDELFRHYEKNRSFSYLDVNDSGSSIAPALEVLKRHHEMRNTRSLSEMLEHFYSDTGIFETLTYYSYLKQSLANLEKIVQQAREFERLNALSSRLEGPLAGSFQQFVRWLDRLEQEEVQETDSLVTEQEDDAIRLMSIHKAKGLEFPVVFLMKLDGDFRTGGDSGVFVLDYQNKKLEFKVGIYSGYFCSSGFEELLEDETPRLDAERRRLLYVACTRARDYLFLPKICSKKPKGYQEILCAAAPAKQPEKIHYSNEALNEPVDLAGIRQEPLDESIEDYLRNHQNWKSSLEKSLTSARNPSLEILTATGQKVLEESHLEEEGRASVGTGPGVLLGTRVHRLLEQWDFTKRSTKDVAQDMSIFLENFFRSGIVDRALSARRYWKEMPFAVCEDGTLLEGAIDLVIEEDDGLIIVDYKTDNVATAEDAAALLRERYAVQGAFYRRALEDAGLTVKRVNFLFLRPGCLLEV